MEEINIKLFTHMNADIGLHGYQLWIAIFVGSVQ